jgi:hypothetical protein
MAAASSRIPQALQHVFMASQRGEEVVDAPKQGIGFKIFQRGGGLGARTKRPAGRPIKAPGASSLEAERSGSRRRDTAADASRKAMKLKGGPLGEQVVSRQ